MPVGVAVIFKAEHTSVDNDNLLNCYVNTAKKWSSPRHVLRLLHADFFALRQKFFQVKNTRGAKLEFEKLQSRSLGDHARICQHLIKKAQAALFFLAQGVNKALAVVEGQLLA